MWRIGLTAAALIALSGTASAQLENPPDLSAYALSSQVPTASSTTPSTEAIGGGVGSLTAQFARGDHTHPRISRAVIGTTDATGQAAVIWKDLSGNAAPLPSTNYLVLPIPIASANAAAPNCWVVSGTFTVTGVSVKCNVAQNTLLSLSIVTAGLTVIPTTSSSAGMSVQVFAIPLTQLVP